MKISVPATSANLGPGFDCLGVAVNLKNSVVIKPSKFHSVSLKGEGSKVPALKENNMFISIFQDFYTNLTQEKKNFRFEFYNEIPLTRGLGSSSAVITSAIASAYAVEGIKIKKDRILNLALAYENHPDNIAPAVMGGFISAVVSNNEVKYIKKSMPKYLKAVVVIPNRPISTKQSRKALPYKYSKEDTIFNVSHASLLSAAIVSEKWDLLKEASQDRVHQAYRMKFMPELFNVQKISYENGALLSTLSGSGSTFFSIVHEDDSNKLLKALEENFAHFKIMCLDFDNFGLKIDI